VGAGYSFFGYFPPKVRKFFIRKFLYPQVLKISKKDFDSGLVL